MAGEGAHSLALTWPARRPQLPAGWNRQPDVEPWPGYVRLDSEQDLTMPNLSESQVSDLSRSSIRPTHFERTGEAQGGKAL